MRLVAIGIHIVGRGHRFTWTCVLLSATFPPAAPCGRIGARRGSEPHESAMQTRQTALTMRNAKCSSKGKRAPGERVDAAKMEPAVIGASARKNEQTESFRPL